MIITKYKLFKESLNTDMWSIIPDSVKELHSLFKSNGKRLFVVGGAVRDFLNNEKPKDFDLCTDAHPEEIISIIGKRYKTNLQGKDFGVVVVYTKDEPSGMEIATFRSDTYDGKTRNPKVTYTTIDQDVLRRDIPFNSLFYDLDKRDIIDLVGGKSDIENKITKFVGNPSERIKEDPLRILRICRFNSRYQFTIDTETKESIKENKETLKIISRERIWDEILKAWKQAKDFKEYFDLFNELDLWGDIFVGSKINTDIDKSNYLEIYIANLFYFESDTSSLLEKLIQSYKIDRDFARRITFLLDFLKLINQRIKRVEMRNYDMVPDLYKKKEISGVSDEMIMEWFNIHRIDDECDNITNAFLKYKPSISAEDLMSQGFKGKELGLEIKRREIEEFKKQLK